MDVDSMLEISSQAVRNVINDKVETVTNTIIPEKFRIYEGNKKGVLDSPTAECLGPFGSIYIADTAKGKLFSARLHYPVDESDMWFLEQTTGHCRYKEGGVWCRDGISCVNHDYSMVK